MDPDVGAVPLPGQGCLPYLERPVDGFGCAVGAGPPQVPSWGLMSQDAPPAEDEALAGLLRLDLASGLARLPDDERATIELAYFGGLAYALSPSTWASPKGQRRRASGPACSASELQ